MNANPSMADAPFHCPPDPVVGGIIIDLPPPISVNRLWRKTKTGVIKSLDYKHWIKRADDMLLEFGQLKGVKPIVGQFTALIVVKPSNLDLDNNSKCVLDYLQSRNFIVNDSLCRRLVIEWGHAPTGCRVTIAPAPTVNSVLERAAAMAEKVSA